MSVIFSPIPKAFAQFTDVVDGSSHFVAINSLQKDGIIKGYEDGSFRPKENISRAEALKIITLASKIITEDEINNSPPLAEKPFPDVGIDAWYAKYVKAAKDKGIIKGYSDGTFKPNKTVSLAETLKLYLASLDDISYPEDLEKYVFADTTLDAWYGKYVAFAAENQILNISSKNEIFPDTDMTRGYFAEMIYRFRQSNNGYRFGKATYYGGIFHNRQTASGETFDTNYFTAAHRTLPFGTMLEVTNLANGKSITVVINDRGPYGYGRVLDLSEKAFEMLEPLSTGVINIQYKEVQPI